MKLFSALALLASLSAASAASGATLYFDAETHHDVVTLQLTPPPGVTFSAEGGEVGYDVREGFGFVGVTGPGGNVEIDQGQTLIVNFAIAQIFSNLTLGLLFDDEFGDQFEAAGVLTDGSSFQFILAVTGESTATWNGPGAILTNLSPAAPGGGGVWSIDNPFGNLAVTSLRFTAGPNKPDNSSDDYGLIRFTSRSASVPDVASTALLLGLSLAALVGVASRRRGR